MRELTDVVTPPDLDRYFLHFQCEPPDSYQITALLHEADGLLSLDIRRVDLVGSNLLEPL